MIYDWFIAPFTDPAMQRAFAAAGILALCACPIGLFLMLRGMSLTGDAMSHAILPGVGLAFALAGPALLPMTFGGLAAGLAVALASGAVARLTMQREDASLAAFYLISLALGVLLVTLKGSSDDLLHLLFGNVMELSDLALYLMGGAATLTLAGLAILWRPLVADCLDALFLRTVSRAGPLAHMTFLALTVLSLVAGFQALGTLMTVGMMILPGAAARFWYRSLEHMCLAAICAGIVASAAGLLVSHHFHVPPGPSIILAAGAIYLMSLIFGRHGLKGARQTASHHRTA
jgi:zinc/manganese transport system permease protein